MNKLTQKELKELLRYNYETGIFTWELRGIEHFKEARFTADTNCRRWNTRFAKKQAGFVCSTWGYVLISVLGKKYRAHHLVFLYMYGHMPTEQVDHINHRRADNRLCNLRAVSHRQNSLNQSLRGTNTSGYCGVYFNKKCRKWVSHIMVSGKTIGLGIFIKKTDAINARCEANKKYEFHQNHGSVST